jgi:hypothetical protein
MVEQAPTARRIPRRTRQLIQGLLSLALVVSTIAAACQVPGWGRSTSAR